MADVSNKDMHYSKILGAINHIKNISKKKPTVDNIHKYLVNHDLDLEMELLQVFLDNLQEEDNVEIYGNRNKEKCYNVKVSANTSSITTTKENTMESTTDTPISLDTNTPLKTSSNSLCSRNLENSKDSQADFVHKKKPVEENNLHLCQQLFLSQKEHIACLDETISHLRGELNCKQKVIDNLLERHDEKYFALQNQTFNFDQKNVNKSGTAIYTNKETINIDKETINNNQKRNKKCITVSNQQSNQRHTDDIIETTISNAINNAEPPRNDNRNIETTRKNESKDNNDKEKSKRVYILGDSIIKHVKG